MLRLALAPLLVMLAAATAPPVLLREQAWTASSSDLAHHLTHRPRECAQSRTSETEIGRALFRAPVLFGGPTARLGLSCQSCHSSGRVNAQFFLPELTDRAGAADVTSEWASHVRGDGIVNPVDIPDLAGVAERLDRSAVDVWLAFAVGVAGVVADEQVEPPALAGVVEDALALRAGAGSRGL